MPLNVNAHFRKDLWVNLTATYILKPFKPDMYREFIDKNQDRLIKNNDKPKYNQ